MNSSMVRKRRRKLKILLLDNYDSFTYNLKDYLEQCNTQVTVVYNDKLDPNNFKDVLAYDAIVISPGPRTPSESGITMRLIEYIHNKKPLLGVCLGHQAIGEFFGGSLEKTPKPMHGKVSPIDIIAESNLFLGMNKTFNVCRYHSLTITRLPKTIIPLAYSKDGCLMAFKHKNLPIYGVQFHPEALLTENGLKIIRNWVDLINTQIVNQHEDDC